ncbi:hypothetical protein [Devosia psychrophila]|jgi:hypothetical protein|uniref:Uncharacterized protein n=1 Tax=Devosia psychrophila TaxID=728005 RepID=A0A0F5PWA3_9HYPH|nr:hypothetical protein [Devosia psychrophila]KKC32671.1 hypothetical protein WH91_12660 [Devosia psychrophila]SFC51872.1 hypothetical protein SAMN04488059_10687 [Devosia psychrophila]
MSPPNSADLQSRLDFIGLDDTARQRQARLKGHVDKHLGKKAASPEDVLAAADEMALALGSLIKSTLLDIDIGVSA